MPIIGVTGGGGEQPEPSFLERAKQLALDKIEERFHEQHKFPQRAEDGSIDVKETKRVLLDFAEAEFRATVELVQFGALPEGSTESVSDFFGSHVAGVVADNTLPPKPVVKVFLDP